MKRILILLLLSPFIANAQSDSSIRYFEVVTIDSTAKLDLYSRAKLWVVNGFKDSKSVIQLDSKEDGQILSKGNTTTYYNYHNIAGTRKIFGTLSFTLNILTKDGKYKVEIYDLSFKDTDGNPFGNEITSSKKCPIHYPMISDKRMNEMWADLKNNIDIVCKATLLSLKQSMTKKIDNDF